MKGFVSGLRLWLSSIEFKLADRYATCLSCLLVEKQGVRYPALIGSIFSGLCFTQNFIRHSLSIVLTE